MLSVTTANARVGLQYLISALLVLAAASVIPSAILKLLSIWIALSLMAVAIAYLSNTPGIFRKSDQGQIPAVIRWVFVPFLVGVWAYNLIQRYRDKTPNIQRVSDKLFVGGRLLPGDIAELKRQQITAVLDVTAEFNALDRSLMDEPVDYLNIPVLDHAVPASASLSQALNWIYRKHQNNQTVLVHCALGRGRSVLVIAAYLLACGDVASVEAALDQIRSSRLQARLNAYQRRRLQALLEAGKLRLNRPVWLIANPVAGGGKWAEYESTVVERLRPYYDLTVTLTTPDTGAEELAQQARDQGAEMVIACGGDGTLSAAAAAIIGSDVCLGIIPMGTANALGHALFGVESKLSPIETALRILIHGRRQRIDTASCNGRPMLLVAALGFEEQMISYASRDEKDSGGQLAYLQGFWQALQQNQQLELSLQLDDQPATRLTTTSLVVANASPVTSILAQGNGQPDVTDGKLDITWLKPGATASANVMSVLDLMTSVLNPDADNPTTCATTAKKIVIDVLQGDTQYAVDGEILAGMPLGIRVNPASLYVMLPADSAASS